MPDEIPDLITAARAFIKVTRDLRIPDGPLKETMPDNLQNGKGLGDMLKGLAEFIDQYQELVSVEANRALLERLRGQGGKNLSAALTDIAVASEDELPAKQALLQSVLTVGGKNLFEAMRLAIKNIARDKKMQLDDNELQALGVEDDDEDPQRRDSKDERKRDKGTWRESLHKGGNPGISDADIRSSAQQYDREGNPIDKDAIRRSAQDGPGEFTPTDDHRSEYERMEEAGIGDAEFDMEQRQAEQEIRAYYNVARRLAATYKKILVPALQKTRDRPFP